VVLRRSLEEVLGRGLEEEVVLGLEEVLRRGLEEERWCCGEVLRRREPTLTRLYAKSRS
jgi:hypothetical protein